MKVNLKGSKVSHILGISALGLSIVAAVLLVPVLSQSDGTKSYAKVYSITNSTSCRKEGGIWRKWMDPNRFNVIARTRGDYECYAFRYNRCRLVNGSLLCGTESMGSAHGI